MACYNLIYIYTCSALRKLHGSVISLPRVLWLQLTAPDNDIPTPSRKAPRALEKMPRSSKHDTNSCEALWNLSLVAGSSDSIAIQICPVYNRHCVSQDQSFLPLNLSIYYNCWYKSIQTLSICTCEVSCRNQVTLAPYYTSPMSYLFI